MDEIRKYGVLSRSNLKSVIRKIRADGKKIVFTNGCFDILHVGHLRYLQFAREQGDILIVGLNSDSSVRKHKGIRRPVVPQDERSEMLLGLRTVDFVIIFEEDEPEKLISEILPDVLVKGEDWAHYVSGRSVVEANGGKVVLAKMVEGRSTTNIIAKLSAREDD